MVLDMTSEQAQKWQAANGKYNEQNPVHRFRYWRYKNGYSLREAAEVTGLNIYDLSHFERGKQIHILDMDAINRFIESIQIERKF